MASDVTQVIERLQGADSQSANDLLPLVYQELRVLAISRMMRERSDHTLQATALVHEAYMRLTTGDGRREFRCKSHFFAAAAEAMRRILIDHARRKHSLKRGLGFKRIDLSQCDTEESNWLTTEQLLELDDQLEQLKTEDPLVSELVGLRLYAGLSMVEAAEALNISRSAAYQYWDFALAWFASQEKSVATKPR